MTEIPQVVPPPPPSDDPWEVAAREFDPRSDYYAHPELWVNEKLGEFVWSKQVETMYSVRDNRYTAVMACHGPGKSFILARIMAKWIDEHPEGEAFVVSTAPTSAQISAILWRELIKTHKKGGLVGRIVSSGFPEWKLPDGEIVGYGRKPADYDDAAFQGIHALHVLVVIDEASGISQKLFDSVDALVTNTNGRVVAIGNPDDPTSHFAEICKPDSGWNVIRIDGLRTPNFNRETVLGLECPQCKRVGSSETLLARLFREEAIPFSTEPIPDDLVPRLVHPLWVEERLHRWVGRATQAQSISKMASQSALFTAKVRGLFPTSASEGVIPLGWCEAAMQRWQDWFDAGQKPPSGVARHGVDVAGKGDDETAIAIRVGNVTLEVRKYRHADTMEVASYVTAAMNPYREMEPIAIVDAIGIGAGVVDKLREMDEPVHPFTASGSATHLTDRSGEFKFADLRAAAWWNMRELLDPSRGSTIMIPNSEVLKADLTTPRWKLLAGAKIRVESKDDLKERLGRSTDEGDAVVQAHWLDAASTAGEDGSVSWWDGLTEEELISWGVEGMDLDDIGLSLPSDREGW